MFPYPVCLSRLCLSWLCFTIFSVILCCWFETKLKSLENNKTCTHAPMHSYHTAFSGFLSDSNWGPFQQQISFPTTKLTFLHPYRTRSNERIMDQFEQNQAALRRDMDVMGEE